MLNVVLYVYKDPKWPWGKKKPELTRPENAFSFPKKARARKKLLWTFFSRSMHLRSSNFLLFLPARRRRRRTLLLVRIKKWSHPARCCIEKWYYVKWTASGWEVRKIRADSISVLWRNLIYRDGKERERDSQTLLHIQMHFFFGLLGCCCRSCLDKSGFYLRRRPTERRTFEQQILWQLLAQKVEIREGECRRILDEKDAQTKKEES